MTYLPFSIRSHLRTLPRALLSAFGMLILMPLIAAAAFAPGATLNPGCAPTDPACTVTPPAISGHNTDIFRLTPASSPTLLLTPTGNQVGIGVLSPVESLDLSGGVRLGNTTGANSGTIRWTGTDFEGYTGVTWASLTATGEANTASNTGTAGVGVFKQKSGVNLEFYKLNPASNKLNLTLNATDRIDLDVNEANLTLNNLAGTLSVAKGGTNITSYTKGDILVATDATTLVKLGVGTDNKILTADSAQAAGVKWAVNAAEANTASNIGTAGVGVLKDKVGVDLRFKNINAASSKVSVTDNGVANTIDIDIVPANITIASSQVSDKGLANGLATLDATGKLPTSQVPAIAISNTYVVADTTARDALSSHTGDVAVVTALNKSYIFTQGGVWQELLTPTDTVLSVNGQTGAVTLTTTNIAEGTNLYYTDARARAAVSVANPLSYNSGTGAFGLKFAAPLSLDGSNNLTIANGAIAAAKLVGTDISTVGTITTGTWNGTTIAIANGGTGQTTANDALNALLPSQTDNDEKFLQTDGTDASWVAGGSGTVTSVSGSGGTTGLTLSGGPITTSGTLALGGTLAVANGGTGLTSGTSGGVLGFTASGTLASSAALAANQLVLGGGAGATPVTLGSLGTITTVLHGNAAGAPTFGAVAAADLASGVIRSVISAVSTSALGTDATKYVGPAGNNATEAKVSTPLPYSCTIKNLYVKLNGDVGGTGVSVAVTIRKNASDTSVTCTITGASGTEDNCSDTSNTSAFSAGDLWAVKATSTGNPGPGDFVKVGFECAI